LSAQERIARSDGGTPLVLAGPTAAVLDLIGDAEALLTGAELARAGAFRQPSDRSDFVAAHALVRLCAARQLPGVEADGLTVVQRCAQCGGAHGRPMLLEAPRLAVSLTHTQGYVAAVAGFGPVGIDAEMTTRRHDLAAAELALHPSELDAVKAAADPPLAFLRQWVRKEALVKLGAGTIDGMRSLNLAALPLGDELRDHTRPAGPGERVLSWDRWQLLDWWQPAVGAIGTAVARIPPSLVTIPAGG
jgi:4'-phosphopantetheinyl transferase